MIKVSSRVKRRNREGLIWLAASAIIALLVFACAPAATAPPATPTMSTEVKGAQATPAAPAPAATPAAAAPAAGAVSLTMLVPEGPGYDVVTREVIAEYQQANPNVRVQLEAGSNAVSYPKVVAARQTTPNQPLYNIYFANPETIAKGDTDGMWMPLDTGNMSNAQDIISSYRRPEDKGIGFGVGLIGLLYNSDRVQTPPASWQDLWGNQEFRGRVVLFDYLWAYNGLVVAARLNGGSEDNMDPGFQTWADNAEQIRSLVTSTQQMKDLLVNGDAWLTAWFKGNQVIWEKEGSPLGFSVPSEGGVAFPLYWTVVAGTTPEQKRVAEEIIDLALSPKYQSRLAETSATAPANRNVQLPAELANDPAYSPEALERAIQLDWTKMAANNQAWRDRWDREVKANLR